VISITYGNASPRLQNLLRETLIRREKIKSIGNSMALRRSSHGEHVARDNGRMSSDGGDSIHAESSLQGHSPDAVRRKIVAVTTRGGEGYYGGNRLINSE
jgi:hypothetical protein